MAFMTPEMPAPQLGHMHPISHFIRRIYAIFSTMGFSIIDGPEVESEYYNFDALNVPRHHPARDMQDTFWLHPEEKREVLRTHDTAVDVRFLEQHQPPVRVIAPGKVFRNEATDATHEAQFYQIDGMVVEPAASMATLKGTLDHFYKELLGPDAEVRFRPSYFPFVEPGVEIDVKFRGKWLEVMGAGMFHPNVISAAKLDPNIHRGFAFGGGIDRLAMIYYNVPDVRLFYTGDTRVTNQF
jgi:phenylalanyl-tRNA synthetase alpha chain